VSKDGRPPKTRTSIDVDPRILAVFEAKAINKSAWFDRMAKLYFGLTNLDEEICKLQSMDAAIAIARQEDERREIEKQRQEVAALMAAQAGERQAIAEKDRSESHARKLQDAWLVFLKKRKQTPHTIFRKLPDQDTLGDFVDFWPDTTRELSSLAGEEFSEDEVIAHARRQVCV
jgi:hypothetical protein